MKLFIGLMSGTSMDGIDAALVDMNTNQLIAGITRPYSDSTLQFLHAVMNQEKTGLGVISQLDTLVGREFAYTVQDLLKTVNVSPEKIEAIGSHGQTICHDTTVEIPYTVQVGCAHTIAELTNITVVADFRTRDLVVGGQGAPFAPIYHQALFGEGCSPLAVVNIGGISNISYLAQGLNVSGYDIGPGNCLMDEWINKNLGKSYDAQGAWASSGEVIASLLSNLLKDPYFIFPAPKSIGKEYFSIEWLSQHLNANYSPKDVQATLLAFTATTISHAIDHCHLNPSRLILCGGGARNTALRNELIKKLPDMTVEDTNALGVDPDFLEAMMFAWLAEKTLSATPIDLTHITGARLPTVLGAIYKRRTPLT